MTKITFTTSTGYTVEVKTKETTTEELKKLIAKGIDYCSQNNKQKKF